MKLRLDEIKILYLLSKSMKIKNIILLCLLIFINSNNSYAQSERLEIFEKRAECLKNNGIWREFGNGCADSCESQFSGFIFCSMVIIYGCDCGIDSCYYDNKCISHEKYGIINERKIKQKESSQEEELRQIQRKNLINERMAELVSRYNIDSDQNNKTNVFNNEIKTNSNIHMFYGVRNVNLPNGQVKKVYYNKEGKNDNSRTSDIFRFTKIKESKNNIQKQLSNLLESGTPTPINKSSYNNESFGKKKPSSISSISSFFKSLFGNDEKYSTENNSIKEGDDFIKENKNIADDKSERSTLEEGAPKRIPILPNELQL